MIEQRDLIAQSVDDGILLIDAAEHITWMNPVAANILGAQIGANFSLSDITWGLQIQPLVREILQQRAESLGQIVAQDDRTFQVSVRAFPAESEPAAILLLRDVTELQRLGRVRRDFVANISHELRTPVTSLRLLTDTLAKELTANPAATEWIAKLRQQVDVLQQLAEEMMGLALIESGQMPIRLLETRLIDVVDESLKILRAQAEHKQITIAIDVPPDLCALADPEAVRKVINNLLHNAIKFTPTQGRIVVRARAIDDNVEIEITDNGIGIPARELPRIFERFYKTEQGRAAGRERGTGLGLAIAKHIVEGHGGKIWAESSEGKGSTFFFTLPACGK
jgi:two-component system, OmpR family, phosphate regulon sensor histidine kinase PhoR